MPPLRTSSSPYLLYEWRSKCVKFHVQSAPGKLALLWGPDTIQTWNGNAFICQ